MAFQPDEFRVERSMVIGAPPSVVFPYMNEQTKGAEWSPWIELDPKIKQTFEGPPSGVGAGYTWDGNNEVGAGRSTIIESKPDELVRLKLEFFRPFEGTSTVDFTFKPEGSGTKVTWLMYGPNSFMGRAMGLFVDCDKMCGDQFITGLTKLKSVVEAKNPQAATLN
jgi:uncharacterized protein YndB with AHSA1/START domain